MPISKEDKRIVDEYWKVAPLAEKIEACNENRVTIFAAARPICPVACFDWVWAVCDPSLDRKET